MDEKPAFLFATELGEGVVNPLGKSAVNPLTERVNPLGEGVVKPPPHKDNNNDLFMDEKKQLHGKLELNNPTTSETKLILSAVEDGVVTCNEESEKKQYKITLDYTASDLQQIGSVDDLLKSITAQNVERQSVALQRLRPLLQCLTARLLEASMQEEKGASKIGSASRDPVTTANEECTLAEPNVHLVKDVMVDSPANEDSGKEGLPVEQVLANHMDAGELDQALTTTTPSNSVNIIRRRSETETNADVVSKQIDAGSALIQVGKTLLNVNVGYLPNETRQRNSPIDLHLSLRENEQDPPTIMTITLTPYVGATIPMDSLDQFGDKGSRSPSPYANRSWNHQRGESPQMIGSMDPFQITTPRGVSPFSEPAREDGNSKPPLQTVLTLDSLEQRDNANVRPTSKEEIMFKCCQDSHKIHHSAGGAHAANCVGPLCVNGSVAKTSPSNVPCIPQAQNWSSISPILLSQQTTPKIILQTGCKVPPKSSPSGKLALLSGLTDISLVRRSELTGLSKTNAGRDAKLHGQQTDPKTKSESSKANHESDKFHYSAGGAHAENCLGPLSAEQAAACQVPSIPEAQNWPPVSPVLLSQQTTPRMIDEAECADLKKTACCIKPALLAGITDKGLWTRAELTELEKFRVEPESVPGGCPHELRLHRSAGGYHTGSCLGPMCINGEVAQNSPCDVASVPRAQNWEDPSPLLLSQQTSPKLIYKKGCTPKIKTAPSIKPALLSGIVSERIFTAAELAKLNRNSERGYNRASPNSKSCRSGHGSGSSMFPKSRSPEATPIINSRGTALNASAPRTPRASMKFIENLSGTDDAPCEASGPQVDDEIPEKQEQQHNFGDFSEADVSCCGNEDRIHHSASGSHPERCIGSLCLNGFFAQSDPCEIPTVPEAQNWTSTSPILLSQQTTPKTIEMKACNDNISPRSAKPACLAGLMNFPLLTRKMLAEIEDCTEQRNVDEHNHNLASGSHAGRCLGPLCYPGRSLPSGVGCTLPEEIASIPKAQNWPDAPLILLSQQTTPKAIINKKCTDEMPTAPSGKVALLSGVRVEGIVSRADLCSSQKSYERFNKEGRIHHSAGGAHQNMCLGPLCTEGRVASPTGIGCVNPCEVSTVPKAQNWPETSPLLLSQQTSPQLIFQRGCQNELHTAMSCKPALLSGVTDMRMSTQAEVIEQTQKIIVDQQCSDVDESLRKIHHSAGGTYSGMCIGSLCPEGGCTQSGVGCVHPENVPSIPMAQNWDATSPLLLSQQATTQIVKEKSCSLFPHSPNSRKPALLSGVKDKGVVTRSELACEQLCIDVAGSCTKFHNSAGGSHRGSCLASLCPETCEGTQSGVGCVTPCEVPTVPAAQNWEATSPLLLSHQASPKMVSERGCPGGPVSPNSWKPALLDGVRDKGIVTRAELSAIRDGCYDLTKRIHHSASGTHGESCIGSLCPEVHGTQSGLGCVSPSDVPSIPAAQNWTQVSAVLLSQQATNETLKNTQCNEASVLPANGKSAILAGTHDALGFASGRSTPDACQGGNPNLLTNSTYSGGYSLAANNEQSADKLNCPENTTSYSSISANPNGGIVVPTALLPQSECSKSFSTAQDNNRETPTDRAPENPENRCREATPCEYDLKVEAIDQCPPQPPSPPSLTECVGHVSELSHNTEEFAEQLVSDAFDAAIETIKSRSHANLSIIGPALVNQPTIMGAVNESATKCGLLDVSMALELGQVKETNDGCYENGSRREFKLFVSREASDDTVKLRVKFDLSGEKTSQSGCLSAQQANDPGVSLEPSFNQQLEATSTPLKSPQNLPESIQPTTDSQCTPVMIANEQEEHIDGVISQDCLPLVNCRNDVGAGFLQPTMTQGPVTADDGGIAPSNMFCIQQIMQSMAPSFDMLSQQAQMTPQSQMCNCPAAAMLAMVGNCFMPPSMDMKMSSPENNPDSQMPSPGPRFPQEIVTTEFENVRQDTSLRPLNYADLNKAKEEDEKRREEEQVEGEEASAIRYGNCKKMKANQVFVTRRAQYLNEKKKKSPCQPREAKDNSTKENIDDHKNSQYEDAKEEIMPCKNEEVAGNPCPEVPDECKPDQHDNGKTGGEEVKESHCSPEDCEEALSSEDCEQPCAPEDCKEPCPPEDCEEPCPPEDCEEPCPPEDCEEPCPLEDCKEPCPPEDCEEPCPVEDCKEPCPPEDCEEPCPTEDCEEWCEAEKSHPDCDSYGNLFTGSTSNEVASASRPLPYQVPEECICKKDIKTMPDGTVVVCKACEYKSWALSGNEDSRREVRMRFSVCMEKTPDVSCNERSYSDEELADGTGRINLSESEHSAVPSSTSSRCPPNVEHKNRNCINRDSVENIQTDDQIMLSNNQINKNHPKDCGQFYMGNSGPQYYGSGGAVQKAPGDVIGASVPLNQQFKQQSICTPGSPNAHDQTPQEQFPNTKINSMHCRPGSNIFPQNWNGHVQTTGVQNTTPCPQIFGQGNFAWPVQPPQQEMSTQAAFMMMCLQQGMSPGQLQHLITQRTVNAQGQQPGEFPLTAMPLQGQMMQQQQCPPNAPFQQIYDQSAFQKSQQQQQPMPDDQMRKPTAPLTNQAMRCSQVPQKQKIMSEGPCAPLPKPNSIKPAPCPPAKLSPKVKEIPPKKPSKRASAASPVNKACGQSFPNSPSHLQHRTSSAMKSQSFSGLPKVVDVTKCCASIINSASRNPGIPCGNFPSKSPTKTSPKISSPLASGKASPAANEKKIQKKCVPEVTVPSPTKHKCSPPPPEMPASPNNQSPCQKTVNQPQKASPPADCKSRSPISATASVSSQASRHCADPKLPALKEPQALNPMDGFTRITQSTTPVGGNCSGRRPIEFDVKLTVSSLAMQSQCQEKQQKYQQQTQENVDVCKAEIEPSVCVDTSTKGNEYESVQSEDGVCTCDCEDDVKEDAQSERCREDTSSRGGSKTLASLSVTPERDELVRLSCQNANPNPVSIRFEGTGQETHFGDPINAGGCAKVECEVDHTSEQHVNQVSEKQPGSRRCPCITDEGGKEFCHCNLNENSDHVSINVTIDSSGKAEVELMEMEHPKIYCPPPALEVKMSTHSEKNTKPPCVNRVNKLSKSRISPCKQIPQIADPPSGVPPTTGECQQVTASSKKPPVCCSQVCGACCGTGYVLTDATSPELTLDRQRDVNPHRTTNAPTPLLQVCRPPSAINLIPESATTSIEEAYSGGRCYERTPSPDPRLLDGGCAPDGSDPSNFRRSLMLSTPNGTLRLDCGVDFNLVDSPKPTGRALFDVSFFLDDNQSEKCCEEEEAINTRGQSCRESLPSPKKRALSQENNNCSSIFRFPLNKSFMVPSPLEACVKCDSHLNKNHNNAVQPMENGASTNQLCTRLSECQPTRFLHQQKTIRFPYQTLIDSYGDPRKFKNQALLNMLSPEKSLFNTICQTASNLMGLLRKKLRFSYDGIGCTEKSANNARTPSFSYGKPFAEMIYSRLTLSQASELLDQRLTKEGSKQSKKMGLQEQQRCSASLKKSPLQTLASLQTNSQRSILGGSESGSQRPKLFRMSSGSFIDPSTTTASYSLSSNLICHEDPKPLLLSDSVESCRTDNLTTTFDPARRVWPHNSSDFESSTIRFDMQPTPKKHKKTNVRGQSEKYYGTASGNLSGATFGSDSESDPPYLTPVAFKPARAANSRSLQKNATIRGSSNGQRGENHTIKSPMHEFQHHFAECYVDTLSECQQSDKDLLLMSSHPTPKSRRRKCANSASNSQETPKPRSLHKKPPKTQNGHPENPGKCEQCQQRQTAEERVSRSRMSVLCEY